jgi:hypothetical protein
VHQAAEAGCAVSALPTTLCQLSDRQRTGTSDVETTSHERSQESHELGHEGQLQLLVDLDAQAPQGRNLAGDTRQSAGTDPVLTKRARIGHCSTDLHGSAGSPRLVRNGGGAAAVSGRARWSERDATATLLNNFINQMAILEVDTVWVSTSEQPSSLDEQFRARTIQRAGATLADGTSHLTMGPQGARESDSGRTPRSLRRERSHSSALVSEPDRPVVTRATMSGSRRQSRRNLRAWSPMSALDLEMDRLLERERLIREGSARSEGRRQATEGVLTSALSRSTNGEPKPRTEDEGRVGGGADTGRE